MQKVDISIIVPVYKVEKYIRRCLESIIVQQTESISMECILVDDCSPDESVAIVRQIIAEYKGDMAFVILHHEQNRGLSAARNTGIDVAKGDYLFFVDSDDYLMPGAVAKLFNALSSHPDCQLAMGQYVQQPHTLPGYERTGLITGGKAIRQMFLVQKLSLHAWNKLVRRELVLDNALYFVEGMIYEDCWWSYRLFEALTEVVLIPDVVYAYIDNPTSILNTIPARAEQAVRSYVFTCNKLLDRPYDDLFAKHSLFVFLLVIRAVFIYNHNSVSDSLKKEFFSLRWRLMKRMLKSIHLLFAAYFMLMFYPFRLFVNYSFLRHRFGQLHSLVTRISR